MTAEDLFGWANILVLPGWAILILAPRRVWWTRVAGVIIPALLAALYAGLVMAHLADAGGGFGSIAQVRALFDNDYALVAGWVHYLAFDLMVGAMMAGQMDKMGLARISQAPLLGLIFLLGPLGVFLIWMTQAAMSGVRA